MNNVFLIARVVLILLLTGGLVYKVGYLSHDPWAVLPMVMLVLVLIGGNK